MFSLFPRKSASVLLFRETVQTQYLNKKRKKVHKNSVVTSKHFSNPPILKLLSVCWAPAQWIERSRIEASRTVQESTWKNRVVETPQKVHGRAREVRHADRTRTDVRGPKHPGLVGAGCQKPLWACGLASSSWIAHARLRVRSTDLTCVRRASPRPRASASSRERNCSAKPPVLRRGSRLRCTRPEAAAVSQQPAVARPLSGSRI